VADDDNQDEVKKRSPVLKIILLVLGLVILLAGAVGATLYLTGFFDDMDLLKAEERIEQLDAEAAPGPGPDGAAAPSAPPAAGARPSGPATEPQRVTRTAPQLTRFEYRYLELERELLANLTGSRKVMQVQLALMTRYDDRVFNNVRKHEFALRSITLDVMRQTTEADLERPDFRDTLAERIRESINATLEKFEDFGGVEAVYFTTFVVQ
jgi:flagellar protein FliL